MQFQYLGSVFCQALKDPCLLFHQLFHLVESHQPPTNLIPWITRRGCSRIVSVPVVVVRVVYGSSYHSSRLPRECDMALCTPHLVTSVDFEDGHSACRAGTGLLLHCLYGLDRVFVAYMLASLISTDKFVTGRASPEIAYTAFPG